MRHNLQVLEEYSISDDGATETAGWRGVLDHKRCCGVDCKGWRDMFEHGRQWHTMNRKC